MTIRHFRANFNDNNFLNRLKITTINIAITIMLMIIIINSKFNELIKLILFKNIELIIDDKINDEII